MINALRKYLERQSFTPDALGIFLNPYFIARRSLFRVLERMAPSFKGMTVLDIGCGLKPYRGLFETDRYWGLDVPGGGHSDDAKRCDLFFDGKRLPVSSSSVDMVVSTQVLEHVPDREAFLNEVKSVLKPGGMLFLTVPFVWEEHEEPHDYIRYTSFGIKKLLKDCGFEVREHLRSASYIEGVFQLLSAYVAGRTERLNIFARFFVYASVCSVIQLVGIVASTLLPKAEGLYLDNVVLAQKRSE